MENSLKEKLEKTVGLVNNIMADPDIEIDYCIPEVEMTADNCSVNADPYIIIKYAENEYVERKIRLNKTYVEYAPQEIANLVTFSIQQFKEELDSVRIGA